MKHHKTHAHAEGAAPPEDVVAEPTVDPISRVAELEAELARAKDDRLRAEADLQNARRRAAKESDEAERRGETRAFGAFLTLIDDLERARETLPPGEEGGPLAAGVALVLSRAMDELARLGIVTIDPHGEPFDPHAHEALLSAASAEHAAGAVSKVVARGYRHGERLLRPARVVVSTGPESAAEGEVR